MLEIKTITETTAHYFDKAVNEALAEGWDIVRRDCFITGSDRATTFYAELERIVEEPEEDDVSCDFAHWELTRDPLHPFRCSRCSFKAREAWGTCPNCDRIMRDEE